jgi:hypothetical protein
MPPMRAAGSLTLSLSLLACSSSSPPPSGFPDQPLLTVLSQSGALSVAVRTSPEPPTRGDQSVEFTITDAATGGPRSGLTLEVVPWMPVMSHGTSVVPTVTEQSPGTYLIADVDMFMAGEWELRTTISGPGIPSSGDAGVASDDVTPVLQIP